MTGEYFRGLSTDAKLLYGLLLNRTGVSAKNGWLDEFGRVYIYYTIDEIMMDLNCGHVKAGKLLAELDTEKGIGLIERVKQGQGKPTKIYVKQFKKLMPELPRDNCALSRPTEFVAQKVQKAERRTDKSEMSKATGNVGADRQKMDTSNINKINTENSYINPSINQSDIDVCRETVREQIDYELLCQYYPFDNPDCILELICDVLCSTAPNIKIGNEAMPTSKVQSRFRCLDFSHVAYVLDSFKDCTSKIHNIKTYLITALYNAPLTVGHYYSAAVRHDNAQKFISP